MAAVVRRTVTRAAANATREEDSTSRSDRLSTATRLYLATVVAAALAAILPLLTRVTADVHDLVVFGALAIGAALGTFLIVPTEPNHSFNTAVLFVAAAALLLPPELVVLIGIGELAAESWRGIGSWYSRAFNFANYTLNGLAAWAAAHAVLATAPGPADVRAALAAVAACAVLVGSNHLLLAIVLRLARGRSFGQSGLFSWRSLSTELLLASLGALLAVAWRQNPFLAPLVLAPFVLINRSFSLLELLRRSEGRFRAIYESTAMGIYLADMDGRIRAANGAFVQMAAADSEGLLGRQISEFVHRDDLTEHDALFSELVEGRQERMTLEHRYVRDDGVVGWAHLTESVVRDADGKPAFTIGTAHDVTGRKQLEERLSQAQKMDAVGRLAGGVAHDFNNLLTVIAAHSRFILGSLDGGEPIGREDVEAIAKAAGKASGLTSQLLAFGRRQPRRPRLLDLNAVVLELHPLLDRTLGDDVRIGLDLEAALAPVQADSTQMEQLIVNLAINGSDAMPDGGELLVRTATVTPPERFDEASADRYVVLSVADSGCGMDEATKARMFEPFFTTKATKGTGLGLASVYGIVAQSGGFVDVESEPGAGTTISVYLPAAASAEIADETPARLRPRVGDVPTVLLVDDEDLVRAAARRLLAGGGYSVLEAYDASGALELAREQDVDVLVTDLRMPDLDGGALAERLLAERPGLPVVYVSGYSDQPIASLPKTGGEVRFVQKPFTEDALLGAVRDALEDGEMEWRSLGASAGH